MWMDDLTYGEPQLHWLWLICWTRQSALDLPQEQLLWMFHRKRWWCSIKQVCQKEKCKAFWVSLRIGYYNDKTLHLFFSTPVGRCSV